MAYLYHTSYRHAHNLYLNSHILDEKALKIIIFCSSVYSTIDKVKKKNVFTLLKKIITELNSSLYLRIPLVLDCFFLTPIYISLIFRGNNGAR